MLLPCHVLPLLLLAMAMALPASARLRTRPPLSPPPPPPATAATTTVTHTLSLASLLLPFPASLTLPLLSLLSHSSRPPLSLCTTTLLPACPSLYLSPFCSPPGLPSSVRRKMASAFRSFWPFTPPFLFASLLLLCRSSSSSSSSVCADAPLLSLR